jgi:Glycosyl hydrolase family 3 C-terminal domain/Fibronectin type III-like domain
VGCVPQPVDQDSLISQVAAANPHTIVVLNTGGPVTMPWLSQIKGLFEAWYPGQQDGNAIAALLFGDVDPSAKLPETFPRSRADIPTQTPQQFPGVIDSQGVPQSVYSEGLLVGYRWYDAKHIAPLFPFGFGLSYTSFGYSGLTIAAAHAGTTVAAAGITVTNTGARRGADVPQLYISDPASTGEPPQQLKGYQKVSPSPGQSQRVSFPIDVRALSYWSTPGHSWAVTPGCYGIAVGHDERDIALRATIAVNGARCPGAVASITTPGACDAATGRLSGSRLGPVVLGERRTRVRSRLAGYRRRGRRQIDLFCFAGGGLRVGYPSAGLLRGLSRRDRSRSRGRAVLIVSANPHYALRGVRPGESLFQAHRRLRLGRRFVLGRNTWYLIADGRRRGVLRVQHGRVQEIGIAAAVPTAGRAAAARFLRSFS